MKLDTAERAQCRRLFLAGYRHHEFLHGSQPQENYEPVVYELLRLEAEHYRARHNKEAPTCACAFCTAQQSAMTDWLVTL